MEEVSFEKIRSRVLPLGFTTGLIGQRAKSVMPSVNNKISSPILIFIKP